MTPKHKRREGEAVANSAGMVFGYAQKLDHRHQFIQEYTITAEEVAAELARFGHAIQQASDAMQLEMDELAKHKHADEVIPVLRLHQMMLHDPELVANTELTIKKQKVNAEWALKLCLKRISEGFDHIQDVYFRSRKEDIEHVGQRIFGYLADVEPLQHRRKSIMIAQDFSPSEIVTMWRSGVAGFITVKGGKNSHAMIVARGIGLPGIAGAQDLFEHVEDGMPMLVDAEQGVWVLHPHARDLARCRAFQIAATEQAEALQLQLRSAVPRVTGHHMPLMANLEFHEEVEIANSYGVDGVGLFRTEYLFMQSQTFPSEDEQYRYYAQVVRGMKGKPVTFRLLDAGADKLVYAEELLQLYAGDNPALGLRGVRMLLGNPELLKTQLRAILRVSLLGQVSVLVPMVTTVAEMNEVRALLESLQQELGIKQAIHLGCMIEVPAAVLIARELAEVSDFFSIGSNDLVQYSLAVDRGDDEVSYLYDVSHPAILKLIEMTVEAAAMQNIPVTICGELASNPQWAETFVNLRISSLSMTARNVPFIRQCLDDLQAI